LGTIAWFLSVGWFIVTGSFCPMRWECAFFLTRSFHVTRILRTRWGPDALVFRRARLGPRCLGRSRLKRSPVRLPHIGRSSHVRRSHIRRPRLAVVSGSAAPLCLPMRRLGTALGPAKSQGPFRLTFMGWPVHSR
jgi:hypothetical protein